MIPETAGALLAFLGLVAPGLVFELLRERRRPGTTETAFREASRVALTSLVFTVGALLLLGVLHLVWPAAVVDPQQWLREGGRYVQDNYGLVALTLGLEVVLASCLAMLWHLVLSGSGHGTGRIESGGLWFQVLNRDKPRGSQVWAHVRLTDGTTFWGYVRGYTAVEKLEDRELVLEGVHLSQQEGPSRQNGSMPARQTVGSDWESVVLRGSDIRYLRVQYRDNLGIRVDSARRTDAVNRLLNQPVIPPATPPTADTSA